MDEFEKKTIPLIGVVFMSNYLIFECISFYLIHRLMSMNQYYNYPTQMNVGLSFEHT